MRQIQASYKWDQLFTQVHPSFKYKYLSIKNNHQHEDGSRTIIYPLFYSFKVSYRFICLSYKFKNYGMQPISKTYILWLIEILPNL